MAALAVYIDFKSPYAYLAIEPTRRLAAELGIDIDWYPFVLDIPSYLGSARLDKSGKVKEHSRSPEQWSGVKYAYYDCRRYANLRGMIIRGTEKIWDTHLAAIGMLWAKQQGDDILQRYIDGVYVPFWKRELDVEDLTIVESVLADAGAITRGFTDYALGEGALENQQLQTSAFDAGIFGVPTYLVGDEMYFGREHLPRIQWQLQGEVGPAPDIANPLFPDDRLPSISTQTLDVGVDLSDYASRAAINSIKALAEEVDVPLHWYPIRGRIPGGADDGDRSRGARHRRYRLENHRHDESRYTPAQSGSAAEDWGIEFAEDEIYPQTGPVVASWARLPFGSETRYLPAASTYP